MLGIFSLFYALLPSVRNFTKLLATEKADKMTLETLQTGMPSENSAKGCERRICVAIDHLPLPTASDHREIS